MHRQFDIVHREQLILTIRAMNEEQLLILNNFVREITDGK